MDRGVVGVAADLFAGSKTPEPCTSVLTHGSRLFLECPLNLIHFVLIMFM